MIRNYLKKLIREVVEPTRLDLVQRVNESRWAIMHDLVSRIGLDKLENILIEARQKQKDDGSVDYSFIARAIQEASKY